MTMLHEKIFLLIYHVLGPTSFLSGLTIFFAVWFPWVLGIFPFAYVLYFHDGEKVRQALLRIYIAPILAYVATLGIKYVYQTPRPFALLEIPPSFIVSSDPFGLTSFPSSHTAFFFALAVSMFFFNQRIGWWFFGGALLIGLARIGAGVHWPLDILGGLLLGILVGYATIGATFLVQSFRTPRA